MSNILGRDNCEHKTLRFGSGDYYVFCTDCLTTWVKTKPGTDEADASVNNNELCGEDRIKDESND